MGYAQHGGKPDDLLERLLEILASLDERGEHLAGAHVAYAVSVLDPQAFDHADDAA